MSPRPFLALWSLSLAVGCGGEPPPTGGHFGLELVVDEAVTRQLGAFQLVVLPGGQRRNCTELQRTCLRTQVAPEEALVLRDGQGREGRALRFDAQLQGGAPGTQDVVIEVPVGRDYALVIEALSMDTPPRFLGSSCTYLKEVNAGRNAPVLAAPMSLTDGECDPTIVP